MHQLFFLRSVFRKLTPLRSDKQGVVAIEFALLAIPFFLIFMGILEFSIMMAATAVLEGATEIGSRINRSQYDDNGINGDGGRVAYIKSEIKRLSAGLLDADPIVEVRAYSTFSNIGQPEPCLTAQCGAGQAGVDYQDVNENGKWDEDQGRASEGGAGDVVVYTVRYPWTFALNFVSHAFGGPLQLEASAVTRNEPSRSVEP